MTDIRFRSDMDVDLIQHMGSDDMIARAARVSTGADQTDQGAISGLIKFLASNRHGSPFEHTAVTWHISAPIFVWREIMRHRIASYNEESGRYKQLDPVFYVPAPDRNLVQVGKAGAYSFEPGSRVQVDDVQGTLERAALDSYREYEYLLDTGIAREVARMCLPVNIYSSAYVTMNIRALTNFLSLRTKDDRAMFPSFPQREIEMVAEKMEINFRDLFPQTWNAWVQSGRVAL